MDQPPAPPSPATLSQGHNLYHCLGKKQTNQDLEEAKHCSHARLELRGSPSVVPRPAVPVSPESLLNMHTQVPPRPGSETLGVGVDSDPAIVITEVKSLESHLYYLLCVLRLLFTCPRPVHPGVGHLSTFSCMARTKHKIAQKRKEQFTTSTSHAKKLISQLRIQMNLTT